MSIASAQAQMKEMVGKARQGASALAVMPSAVKDRTLFRMAKHLDGAREELKKANADDIARAVSLSKNQAFIDRLTLSDSRIDAMCEMICDVARMQDPVGTVLGSMVRPNGLHIDKVRVPIGVIGIIYEARPNVTADCTALCVKSGNAVILKGGSDAINSNLAICRALKKGAKKEGMDDGAFTLIEDTSREMVDAMLTSDDGIDLIMPRGGESLIREVVEKSHVPVIKHYKGICHVYVDSKADIKMALDICLNAKIQRPGVCNAMETMLVHREIAGKFLPLAAEELIKKGVRIKACPEAAKMIKNAEEAEERDYSTEWLDLILNVRIVNSIDEAIEHIAKYGSAHSDAIVTDDNDRANEFTSRVDSAAVYVNASTRFTDGAEFGKGAEIGISTDKIHARGPMGIEELCSYKYVVHGTGQIRP
jgi:glutamate-5-semialdehyde dehydrogenase